MGRRSYHRKYLSATTAVVLVGVSITLVVIPSCTYAAASVSTYSKNFYQHPPHSFANTSGAVFEPRGDVGGGGGGGSSYSVGGGASSFGGSGGGYSMGGGGGYDTGGGGGGYGAPAMASPAVYKYQIYPSPAMQMQSYGWGGGDDDEDDDFGGGGGGGFPKELIGLLGLKGLKGLKGFKGVLGLLKGLLLLKKLLGIPLLPILLPLLLPLLLLKLALLIIPLLLILLIPVPVISMGRQMLLESHTGRSFKKYLQDKMDSLMANLPEDISHIVDKIKGSSADLSLSHLLSKYSDNVGTARGSSKKPPKNNFGDTGSSRSKVVYVATSNAANIKPSAKSAKFPKKTDKNQTSKVTTATKIA